MLQWVSPPLSQQVAVDDTRRLQMRGSGTEGGDGGGDRGLLVDATAVGECEKRGGGGGGGRRSNEAEMVCAVSEYFFTRRS